MTLPDGFTPVEHFKSVLIKTYNKLVKEEFKDIEGDLPDNITTPRSSLKTACLVDDKDSSILINNRMMLFYFILRKASDLQAPIAGIPLDEFAQKVTFKPQVTLFFKERIADTDPDFTPLESRVSIRLVDETHLTITNAKLTTIANKIKSQFGGSTPFKFKRGKFCVHYHDKEKGYKFQLYTFSKQEGKNVIDKLLRLVNESPKWEYLTSSENDNPSEAYPTLPSNKSILGDNRRLPRKRPVGNVYFTHATAEVYGVPRPIWLYGSETTFRKALVY